MWIAWKNLGFTEFAALLGEYGVVTLISGLC